jgi:hypothetical protein
VCVQIKATKHSITSTLEEKTKLPHPQKINQTNKQNPMHYTIHLLNSQEADETIKQQPSNYYNYGERIEFN